MHVLRKLTLAGIRRNKKRSIVTIIGILLSTALICAVAGLATSGHRMLVDTVKNSEGDYHIMFMQVPAEAVTYVRDNPNVESCYYFEEIGYAEMPENLEKMDTFYQILAATPEAMDRGALYVTEGRMPQKENEIVVETPVLTRAGVNVKLGDTLSLGVGDITFNDEGYLGAVENAQTKEYTVVGLIEHPSSQLTGGLSNQYTLITCLQEQSVGTAGHSYTVAATYYQPKNFSAITDRICNTLEKETGAPVFSVKNMELLEYEGALSNSMTETLYKIGAVIILIVVGCSAFVIRNSFSISVAEKTKQYGMLASVGATSRQIRGSVLYEGFLLGVIGIPLGVGLGVAAIAIVIQVMNLLLSPMMEHVTFHYTVPPVVLAGSVVLGAVTIYLSCLIPAVRASRIPPMIAIRGNNEIQIKNKKIKVFRLTKKLFGIGGVIASKNLKRSRSKYRTTVISLVVSIAVFVALSSFVKYGKDSTGVYYTDASWNIAVSAPSDEVYDAAIERLHLQDYSYSWTIGGYTDFQQYGAEAVKDYYADDENLWSTLVILEPAAFEAYARSVGVKDHFDSAVILSDVSIQKIDGKREVRHFYKDSVKAGDEIPYTFELSDSAVVKVDFTITKRTDTRPKGFESIYSRGGFIIVSKNGVDSVLLKAANLNQLLIQAEDDQEMESALMKLAAEDDAFQGMIVENAATFVKQQQNLILVVEIFLYGFIVVITLIGVTNIFNTISTNMMLRSKEFAMLRSIGMTDREFNRMIRLESVLYGSKSLLIGLPLGVLLSALLTKSMMGIVDLGYALPVRAMAISVIAVFLIVWITMRYSVGKITKQNIVETIRNENI